MRVVSLVALACAVSGSNAAFLPDFVAGTRFENTQQVIINNFASISGQYAQIVDALDQKKGDFVSKVSQYLNELAAGDESQSPLKKIWHDMATKFPDQFSQLRLKSPARETTGNAATFDMHVTDERFPNHRLRMKATPGDLGIDTVKQYSGYFDINEEEDKHFFYWFFESRNDPKTDPVILWLNGGPGCSSLTGLFFELGPSSINAKLEPEFNPFSWNSNASVIFLDQPVNVGFSYSTNDVSSTVAAGVDVFAFLELFFKQFPEFAKLDFHIAGESYAGHYIPAFSTEILRHPERSFDLTSVMIGNGITDPLTQTEFYRPMACGEGGYPPVLTPEECADMDAAIPRCKLLIEACYNSGSVFACVPASIYCGNTEMTAYSKTGRNVYDIREPCKGGGLCYEELQYVEEYLNQPSVRAKLGVEVESYKGCDSDVGRNFFLTGDGVRPFHTDVAELLEAGVPVLIYAGDKDFICNWLGNQAWVDRLPWSGHDSFVNQPIRNWKVNNKTAGEVKNYEGFTFLRVYDAGHMVPFNQPENALEMITRWTSGDYAF